MRWEDELRNFGPLEPDEVADFASPAAQADAIARYNRAYERIEQGSIDIASIALRQLATAWPDFTEAALLSSCCQMLWGDADSAVATLTRLDASPHLDEAERFTVERYLRAARTAQRELRRQQQNPVSRHSGRLPRIPDQEDFGTRLDQQLKAGQTVMHPGQSRRPLEIASPEEQAEVWQMGQGPRISGTPLKRARSVGRQRLQALLVLLIVLVGVALVVLWWMTRGG